MPPAAAAGGVVSSCVVLSSRGAHALKGKSGNKTMKVLMRMVVAAVGAGAAALGAAARF
jgi:hypothetical protein